MPAFRCSACGVPINRRWGYCWADERAYLRARQRRCADCQVEMPRGRTLKRCTACQTRYVHRLAARGNRRCRCGSKIPKHYTRHACKDCRSMEQIDYENRKRGRR